MNRATNYNDSLDLPEYTEYREFLGQEIEINGASEPTDIVW